MIKRPALNIINNFNNLNPYRSSRPNGFTLIEVLVATLMFTAVILITGTMYVTSQKIYNSSSCANELMQNSRVIFDRISRELRQAADLITVISTSTPVNSIFFQDGHNIDTINYIEYYQSGTELRRAQKAYFFDPPDPNIYVYYDAVDAWGAGPAEIILEDRVIGEYINTFEITNNEGLLNLSINLVQNICDMDVDTEVYIRNW